MVAKSFQSMEILCNPYEKVKGRMYVKVRNPKTGNEREVRWYNEKEYARLYPGEKIKTVESVNKNYSQKKVFGFEKGYITIFSGVTDENEDWFKLSNARYATFWGWYIISTEEVPDDLPQNVTPIKLQWDKVCKDKDSLKPKDELIMIVKSIIYGESESSFIGTVGERLDFTLIIEKAIKIEGKYGVSTLHIMHDIDKNVFVWNTKTKTLEEGKKYKMRGTIKEHRVYKNCQQTILTRCTLI